MLEELEGPLFRFVTPGPVHRVYAYNLDSLVRYVVSSGRFVDPMSGVSFNELEVWRLHKLRERFYPLLHCDVDLQRLAFDAQYKEERESIQRLQEVSSQASTRAFRHIIEAFDPEQSRQVIHRYMLMVAGVLGRNLDILSMVNAADALSFIDNAIQNLQQLQQCPPDLMSWFVSARNQIALRHTQGWRLVSTTRDDDDGDDDEEEEEEGNVIVSINADL